RQSDLQLFGQDEMPTRHPHPWPCRVDCDGRRETPSVLPECACYLSYCLCRIEHAKERVHVLPQLRHFGLELLSPLASEAVVLRTMVLVGHAPLSFDEILSLQAM